MRGEDHEEILRDKYHEETREFPLYNGIPKLQKIYCVHCSEWVDVLLKERESIIFECCSKCGGAINHRLPSPV